MYTYFQGKKKIAWEEQLPLTYVIHRYIKLTPSGFLSSKTTEELITSNLNFNYIFCVLRYVLVPTSTHVHPEGVGYFKPILRFDISNNVCVLIETKRIGNFKPFKIYIFYTLNGIGNSKPLTICTDVCMLTHCWKFPNHFTQFEISYSNFQFILISVILFIDI